MPNKLIDPFQRSIDYVRISVTDRCDLRCTYCMPEGFKDFEEPDNWLTFDEVHRVASAFGALGVSKIRVTGGEPLTRKGLPELIEGLANISSVGDLSMSTNAVRLKKMARPLAKSGLHRVNVSLDSLKADRFAKITGGGKLEKVLAGLQAAKDEGLTPVKINMVVMNGVNDDEVEDLVAYCVDNGFTLRMIETMPVGERGREAANQFISLDEIVGRLEEKFELIPDIFPGAGPARYLKVVGSDTHIGLITPMSRHFCATCNRVRLGVDGTLYLCLGQDNSVQLRPLLRGGASDEELQQAIVQAMGLKPERHEFNEKPEKIVRFMSSTGG